MAFDNIETPYNCPAFAELTEVGPFSSLHSVSLICNPGHDNLNIVSTPLLPNAKEQYSFQRAELKKLIMHHRNLFSFQNYWHNAGKIITLMFLNLIFLALEKSRGELKSPSGTCILLFVLMTNVTGTDIDENYKQLYSCHQNRRRGNPVWKSILLGISP